MHRQWYIHDTILWRPLAFTLWPAIGLSHSSFQTNSRNLPCGTYTQLCLHLNCFSTNLTSLSTLLLRSSPKTFVCFGLVNLPLRHLASQVSFAGTHKPQGLDGSHCLELFRLLSASGTIFPRFGLWIKSTFISAKLSCHRNHLALNCACMSNTFRTHYPCKPLFCATPTSVATSSSNALRQSSFLL